MAVGVFPAAKLGVLALKQISKPIANILKSRAKNSPVFRKFVMGPAQFYNYFEVKTKMLALNLGRPTQVIFSIKQVFNCIKYNFLSSL